MNNTKYTVEWLKKVENLFIEKKKEEAISEISQYFKLYPNDIFISSLYGELLFKSGYKKEAKEVLEPIQKNLYKAKKIVASIK